MVAALFYMMNRGQAYDSKHKVLSFSLPPFSVLYLNVMLHSGTRTMSESDLALFRPLGLARQRSLQDISSCYVQEGFGHVQAGHQTSSGSTKSG